MAGFLETWFNPTLTLEDWDANAFEAEQRTRCIRAALIALYAHTKFRRRLGTDVDRSESAADVKTARKLYYNWLQYAGQWGATDDEIGAYGTANHEELMREAAQATWTEMVTENSAKLADDMIKVATLGIKNGQRKLGNRYGNRLLNEHNVTNKTVKNTAATS